MYVHEIAARNPDPVLRRNEIDAIEQLTFGYVVPRTVAEHRIDRSWIELEGHGTNTGQHLPLLLQVSSHNSVMPQQNSVVEQINQHGVITTLAYPLNIDSEVRIAVSGPQEEITLNARIDDVQEIRIGINVVHRHRLEWTDSPPESLSQALNWMQRQYRYSNGFSCFGRKNRVLSIRNAAWATALVSMVLISTGLFWTTHRNDLLMLAATERPLSPAELSQMDITKESVLNARHISTDRLLRMYYASLAVGESGRAAELAAKLANRIPDQSWRWSRASATLLAQDGEYQQADEILRHELESGSDRTLQTDERAILYLEAARVAIAVGDVERSVHLFAKAGQLRVFDSEQVDEYIGLLVSAGKLKQATLILKQLGASDSIFQRIVDVHEIAKQPQLAVRELETLYARDPDDAAVVRRLAELAFLRKEYETSVDYSRQLQRLLPDDPQVQKQLAETMLAVARAEFGSENLESATNWFRESFELQPPDVGPIRELAGITATLGRTDEAIEILRDQNDAESRMLVASILEMTGQFEETLEQLRKLSDSMVDSPEVANVVSSIGFQKQLVRLLFATERYDESAKQLTELLEQYPDDKVLWRDFINAVASSDANDFDRANPTSQMLGQVFQRYQAIDFEPLNSVDLEQLAYVLRRFDMPNEAIDVLTFALEKHPDSRSLRLLLARALGDLERYEDAEEHYNILLGGERL